MNISPKPYTEIRTCRICGNADLEPVLDLGRLALSGIFPRSVESDITSGPLQLVKCTDGGNAHACGLLQLRQTYRLQEMYGLHYGYRSSLNRSMMLHLNDIAEKNLHWVDLQDDDIIVDIGSNDATLLKSYPRGRFQLVGVDPLICKFKSYYTAAIAALECFFSADRFRSMFGTKKAKIITSIAMLYDLEAPLDFVKDISCILHAEGIWVFEQGFMPLMVEKNAYDTICHEHLEYYGLKQIQWMLAAADLKIIDVELNDTNGGSIKVTAAKTGSTRPQCTGRINSLLESEKRYSNIRHFKQFEDRIVKHRRDVMNLLGALRKDGKRIFGYGASTKGNILLQYCGITRREIEYIAEVNEEKFGAFTPATNIPIISEHDARLMKPDFYFVLPWHFKESILGREKQARASGVKFIFPLPEILVV